MDLDDKELEYTRKLNNKLFLGYIGKAKDFKQENIIVNGTVGKEKKDDKN